MEKPKRNSFIFVFAGLVILPLVLAGLFILAMTLQGRTRFDAAYFTPEFKEQYFSPGEVARTLEKVIRTGDSALYAELSGMRNSPTMALPEPDVVFTILLEVDEAGYFHYMYFDVNTFDRQTHYVIEVDGRWVVSPEDAFFLYDSGLWTKFFAPILIAWWLLLVVVLVGRTLYNVGARTRMEIGRA